MEFMSYILLLPVKQLSNDCDWLISMDLKASKEKIERERCRTARPRGPPASGRRGVSESRDPLPSVWQQKGFGVVKRKERHEKSMRQHQER